LVTSCGWSMTSFSRWICDPLIHPTSDPHFPYYSDQLWFDLRSMILGLEQVIVMKTAAFPGKRIKPVIMNQDLLENIFCQIRSSNGQNNHPKYYMYTSLLKTVNFGQTIFSKTGNTNGNTEALPKAALPVDHPFCKKKKLS